MRSARTTSRPGRRTSATWAIIACSVLPRRRYSSSAQRRVTTAGADNWATRACQHSGCPGDGHGHRNLLARVLRGAAEPDHRRHDQYLPGRRADHEGDRVEHVGRGQPVRRFDGAAAELPFSGNRHHGHWQHRPEGRSERRRELATLVHLPEPAPRRRQLRHVRRLGQVHQELDQHEYVPGFEHPGR